MDKVVDLDLEYEVNSRFQRFDDFLMKHDDELDSLIKNGAYVSCNLDAKRAIMASHGKLLYDDAYSGIRDCYKRDCHIRNWKATTEKAIWIDSMLKEHGVNEKMVVQVPSIIRENGACAYKEVDLDDALEKNNRWHGEGYCEGGTFCWVKFE